MVQFERVVSAWEQTEGFLVPSCDADYQRLVEFSYYLIDRLNETEDSSLASLLSLVGDQIELFERENVPALPEVGPIEILRELMRVHGLKQKDLIEELGPPSVVSEVMNGKRELNKRQIVALSKRFSCSMEMFV